MQPVRPGCAQPHHHSWCPITPSAAREWQAFIHMDGNSPTRVYLSDLRYAGGLPVVYHAPASEAQLERGCPARVGVLDAAPDPTGEVH